MRKTLRGLGAVPTRNTHGQMSILSQWHWNHASLKFLVIFAANFHHELSGDSTRDRLESALREVGKWEDDVKDYRNLVEEEILQGKTQCS